MKISELAEIVNGNYEGDGNYDISDVAKIETAKDTEISFISNPMYEKYYSTTSAGALLVSVEFKIAEKRDNLYLIRVKDPYLAFLKLIEYFHKEENSYSGISDKCSIGENSNLADDVFIGDYTVIGNNVSLGRSSKIQNNCSIGNSVEIGNNCIVYPNVTIYNGCKIGDNVILHSGVVIGSDGFGFAKQENGSYIKIPQKGIVIIENDVEIGSNTTIDRATIGETKICRGVKIDNQVMIGHNVFIDEDTVIVAHTGIAGSTKIGKRCVLAGKVGLGGHISICDDVTIGAMVGMVKSVTKPGLYMGYRGKPMREALTDDANIKKIPKLEEKIKEIENKLK